MAATGVRAAGMATVGSPGTQTMSQSAAEVSPVEALEGAVRAVRGAGQLPAWRLPEAAVGELLALVGELRHGLARVEADTVGEALARGLPGEHGWTATDWVRVQEGRLGPGPAAGTRRPGGPAGPGTGAARRRRGGRRGGPRGAVGGQGRPAAPVRDPGRPGRRPRAARGRPGHPGAGRQRHGEHRRRPRRPGRPASPRAQRPRPLGGHPPHRTTAHPGPRPGPRAAPGPGGAGPLQAPRARPG